ncbi:MAG: hypothetical protein ACE15F_06265 [bacterium]
MMRTFLRLVLGIFIGLAFTEGAAADIHFIRQRIYDTGVFPDQRGIVSYRIEGDKAFYIEQFGYAHQFKFGYVLYMMDLNNGVKKVIHQFYTVIDSPFIEEFPHLTRDIERIENTIDFPDVENYSYQCTLQGDYLGRFPGYQPPPRDSGEIRVAGQPFVFPTTLANETFTDMYIHDEWVIFVGKKVYGIFNKDELAEKGESAEYCFFIFPQ